MRAKEFTQAWLAKGKVSMGTILEKLLYERGKPGPGAGDVRNGVHNDDQASALCFICALIGTDYVRDASRHSGGRQEQMKYLPRIYLTATAIVFAFMASHAIAPLQAQAQLSAAQILIAESQCGHKGLVHVRTKQCAMGGVAEAMALTENRVALVRDVINKT